MSLFGFRDFGGRSKLYISTVHDKEKFRELLDGYWIPSNGRAMFARNIDSTCPEDTSAPNTNSSIYLCYAHLHTKTSYYGFFDMLRKAYEQTPWASAGLPPVRPSFDRPALILKEHEFEDGATRSGAGFTTFTAYVCLPAPLRDGIGAELKSRTKNRLVVVGFPIDHFDLPQERKIVPNSKFDARLWTFEVDDVEIKVF
jgi:hypothetical protein